MGRKVIPVVEKYTELALILKYAEKVGVRPQIGMRIKLAARGSGRWQSSNIEMDSPQDGVNPGATP